jgi:hypothetical protein
MPENLGVSTTHRRFALSPRYTAWVGRIALGGLCHEHTFCVLVCIHTYLNPKARSINSLANMSIQPTIPRIQSQILSTEPEAVRFYRIICMFDNMLEYSNPSTTPPRSEVPRQAYVLYLTFSIIQPHILSTYPSSNGRTFLKTSILFFVSSMPNSGLFFFSPSTPSPP